MAEPKNAREDQGEKPKRRKGAKRKKRRTKSVPLTDPNFRRFFRMMRDGGDSSEISDAVSQALIAVMGSVPSFAVAESMIAAGHSQGEMFEAAVANQQRMNLVGMVSTVGCVSRLLKLPDCELWEEIEDEQHEDKKHNGPSVV